MKIMSLIFFGFLGFMSSSFVEYMMHRIYLHRDLKNDHVLNHHKNYHGKKSYEIKNSKKEDIVSSNRYILLNVLFYSFIAFTIVKYEYIYGIVFFTVAISYTILLEFFHYRFHSPKNKWYENTKIFLKIKENHKVHHYKYQKNYGIGSSIWDHILRTYVKK